MSVRVTTGARLHFGFRNLARSGNCLYGGIGVVLDEPRVVVEANQSEGVHCDDTEAAPYVACAVELLGVPGADVTVVDSPLRHVGLGSGTQLALAAYVGIARAYGRDPDVRAAAPDLGRGGRSGVGVAGFEHGGFVVDEGHPAEEFTPDQPARGAWTVPPVAVRHSIPDDWRFVVAVPDAPRGRSGDEEDASMRTVIERADPVITEKVEATLERRVIPAIEAGDHERFGTAVAEIDGLNGAWYADEQGGVYRPPVGTIVEHLSASPAISGVGQTSWGPAVYGVTGVDGVDAARDAGWDALEVAGVDGDVLVAEPRNGGARVVDIDR